MKPLTALTALVLLAAACGEAADTEVTTTAVTSTTTTTTAPGDPTSPPGDRSPVFVDDVKLVMLESYPVQVRAIVTGSLPTPCHRLQWELTRDETAVTLELWSLRNPETVCIQVLEPFEETIDVGAFESGSYLLMVNGESHPFEV